MHFQQFLAIESNRFIPSNTSSNNSFERPYKQIMNVIHNLYFSSFMFYIIYIFELLKMYVDFNVGI